MNNDGLTQENLQELEVLERRLNVNTNVGGDILKISDLAANAIMDNRRLQMIAMEGRGWTTVKGDRWSCRKKYSPQNTQTTRTFSSNSDHLTIETDEYATGEQGMFFMMDEDAHNSEVLINGGIAIVPDIRLGVHGSFDSRGYGEVRVGGLYFPNVTGELTIPNKGNIATSAVEKYEQGKLVGIYVKVSVFDYTDGIPNAQNLRETVIEKVQLASLAELAEFLKKDNIYSIVRENIDKLDGEKGHSR
jgi:hypothetical protein